MKKIASVKREDCFRGKKEFFQEDKRTYLGGGRIVINPLIMAIFNRRDANRAQTVSNLIQQGYSLNQQELDTCRIQLARLRDNAGQQLLSRLFKEECERK